MNDDAAQKVKVGTFEWITEFDDIHSFLEPCFTGLGHIPKSELRVLVAGCGTSLLSIQLADAGFGKIVSVDNDCECISHMKSLHHNDQRLQWFTYDMVDPASTPFVDELMSNDLGLFDMIVDKGTLDAILVEGAIYTMLHKVHKLLKVGGVYVVISLNTENLLAPLLGCPALGFQIDCHKIRRRDTAQKERSLSYNGDDKDEERIRDQPENSTDIVQGTVVICKKAADSIIDLNKLAEEEKTAMDNYFKVESPFLTNEQEQKIRMNFEGSYLAFKADPTFLVNKNSQSKVAHNDNWCLSLDRAYIAMFEGDQNLEYSYELFLEDVHTYPLAERGYMTVEEALSFLQMMQ